MRHFYNLFFLLTIVLMASSKLFAQDPVIFSTGGTYGAPGNHVKIYSYHPDQDTIYVQDSVPGDFSNDVLYDGKYCYLHVGRADSTDAIYQYDPYTFDRLDSIQPISGTQNLGVYNDHLVVTRGFATSSASEYVRVYDRNNISGAPVWNGDTIGEHVNGLTFRGDSAYLGYTQNDSGYIATLDLAAASPTFGSKYPMDTLAGGINQLVQDSDSLYALSERYDGNNLMYASITAFDPSNGGYSTDTNSFGASSAVIARNDSVWAAVQDPLDVYESSSGSFSQYFPVDYTAGYYQEQDDRFFFQRTDFFSSGDLLITDGNGSRVDSFTTDISGSAIDSAASLEVSAQGDSIACTIDALGSNFPMIASSSTDTGTWVTSGTGTFVYPDSLYTEYQPSSDDTLNGSVTLTFYPEESGTYKDSAKVTLTFFSEGVVDAAPMDSMCGTNDPVQLDASTNTGALQWSSNGSGSFSDVNDPQASYDPSTTDTSNGDVRLYVESLDNASCAVGKDSVQIMLGPVISNAGPDMAACELDDSVQLDGGFSANATVAQWMSNGDGSFVDDADTNTNYLLGSNDKSNGSVDLYLQSSNEAFCSKLDTMSISLDPEPVADPGTTPIQCVANGGPAQLTGSSNTGSGEWSTSGTGSFGNATMLSTDYSFSANDASNGRVTVSLATTNPGACAPDTASTTLVLEPDVSTAPDIDTTVNADSLSVGGSVSSEATQWHWSTYGSGTFTDTSMVSTFYTPSQADKNLGSVNLLLTASNDGDCPQDDVLNIDFIDTDIREEANEAELSMELHPVPASSELVVKLPAQNELSKARFRIIDLTGKVLREGDLPIGTPRDLSVEDLEAGSYLISIETDQGTIVRKWSKR